MSNISNRLKRGGRTIRFILKHPLTQKDKSGALKRYCQFHLTHRLIHKPVLYDYVGGVKYLAYGAMGGITGNYYVGLVDFEEMGFLLHFLHEDDLFVDVGANVGAYTLLASGFCCAKTISIEPISVTFEHLILNLRLNDLVGKVTPYNLGAGSVNTVLQFTQKLDVLNRVVLDTTKIQTDDLISVTVVPLDQLLGDLTPVLMKVDVEGYEYEVVQGAMRTIQSKNLRAIIIEMSGHGSRYKHSDDEIHTILTNCGFNPCRYDPFSRTLQSMNSHSRQGLNTIYVRDRPFVETRLQRSEPFYVLGERI